MNRFKLISFFMFLFFLVLKIFCYQAPEKYIVSGALQIEHHENIGTSKDNKIFLIKDHAQFAAKVVNNRKPVIVKLFSNKTEHNKIDIVYQSLCNKIGDVVFFASINTDISYKLNLMLKNILNFDDSQLPLIIFFKNGQMILPAFSGTVSEQNLFNLVKSRFGNKLLKVDASKLKKLKNKQIKSTGQIVLGPIGGSSIDEYKKERNELKGSSIWKNIKEKIKRSFWAD